MLIFFYLASYYNEFCLFRSILVVKQSFGRWSSEALFSAVSGCYQFAA